MSKENVNINVEIPFKGAAPSLFNINKIEGDSLSLNPEAKKAQLRKAGRDYKQKKGVLVYTSKGIVQNLNFKARDKEGNAIVCRHLAGYLGTRPRGIKGHQTFFSSIEAIQTIDHLRENHHDAQNPRYNAAYHDFIWNENLGVALSHIASVLERGYETTLFLCSDNHLMAITVMHKKVSDDASQYIIKFYDPNQTSTHQRGICVDLNAIATLALSDFLNKEEIELYYPLYTSSLLSSTKIRKEEQAMVQVNTTEFTAIIFHALCVNVPDTLTLTLSSVFTNTPADKLMSVLAAKHDKGMPGLYIAMGRGHIESVKIYVNSILNNNTLSVVQKKELLRAKNQVGLSGLGTAISEGHFDVVVFFMNSMRNAKDINFLKCNIVSLPFRKEIGDSFNTAMGKNDWEMVWYVARMIMTATNISALDKMLLLLPRKSEGALETILLSLDNQKEVKDYICFLKKHLNLSTGYDWGLFIAKTPKILYQDILGDLDVNTLETIAKSIGRAFYIKADMLRALAPLFIKKLSEKYSKEELIKFFDQTDNKIFKNTLTLPARRPIYRRQNAISPWDIDNDTKPKTVPLVKQDPRIFEPKNVMELETTPLDRQQGIRLDELTEFDDFNDDKDYEPKFFY